MSSLRQNELRRLNAGDWSGTSVIATILSSILAPVRAARGGRLTSHRDRYWIACLLSLLPLRLYWLLHTFGSDKQKVGEHSYGATYHEVLRRFRYKKVNLLEIGVLGGASLLAWCGFFPRGTIVGCDIDPKEQFDQGRISTHVTDQSSPSDLKSLCTKRGPFDIIIDDGSHRNAHQIFTFYEIFKALKDNGVYVIEDVQTSYWPGIYGGANVTDPQFARSCVGEFLELAKYLNHNEFFLLGGLDERRLATARMIKRIGFEHNLIIIQKGMNDEPSNYERQLKADVHWKGMS
jgi:hypothetical protein